MNSERKRREAWPQLVNLRLWHSSVKDFTKSPCFSPIVLCIYRGIAALYLMLWWLYNMSTNMQKGKMFIYFTNLSFTVIAFYFAVGTNLSCISIMQRRDQRYVNEEENLERQPLAFLNDRQAVDQSKDFKTSVDKDVTISENVTTEEETSQQACTDTPTEPSTASPARNLKDISSKSSRKLKSSIEEEDEDGDNSFSGPSRLKNGSVVCHQVYWLLYNISTNTGVLLTIGHWYRVFEDHTFYANVVTKEVVGTGLVVMETLICGIPVRMCHVVYPMIFSISYILFTVIYWASGGTGAGGKSYIYPLLDYDNISLRSFGILFLTVFVGQPLTQLAFYVVYVTRRCLANRVCRRCCEIGRK